MQHLVDSFNSKVVQLKDTTFIRLTNAFNSFNSKVVQLKVRD